MGRNMRHGAWGMEEFSRQLAAGSRQLLPLEDERLKTRPSDHWT
jgi:hypothetical protein